MQIVTLWHKPLKLEKNYKGGEGSLFTIRGGVQITIFYGADKSFYMTMNSSPRKTLIISIEE